MGICDVITLGAEGSAGVLVRDCIHVHAHVPACMCLCVRVCVCVWPNGIRLEMRMMMEQNSEKKKRSEEEEEEENGVINDKRGWAMKGELMQICQSGNEKREAIKRARVIRRNDRGRRRAQIVDI